MSLILNGTDGLSDIDGTAATPAIRGTDTNTGIFFPAADTIAFSEGGTEVARFDANGRLGIGTTSPAFNFQCVNTAGNSFISAVSSNSTTAGILLGDTDSATVGRVEYNNTDNAMLLFTSGSEQARITSAGLLQFNSGYGSVATAFGVRAWVTFNGSGSVAIQGSGNISSIVDNGPGNYTVNFTTAMPDNTWSGQVTCGGPGGSGSSFTYTGTVFARATGSGGINSWAANGGVTLQDPEQVNFLMVR
jgi:hypothetical protein